MLKAYLGVAELIQGMLPTQKVIQNYSTGVYVDFL
jgi:hypothetical protein